MLVAVVSDTHLPRGSRTLPQECARRLRAADLVLHAGDHSTLTALEELRALGPPVHAVHGNVDEPALREVLAAELVVDAGGVRIAVVHDAGPRSGREERLAARFAGCGAVVYGHTHLPQVTRHGGTWILNPGSPTERRRAPARTMLELRVEAGELAPELVDLP
ncbi:MAG TPA: metallophosphoesterase family protein [Gaiellaceae bacterium]|nr:metallophosphoesterase family protein [Gaiellaceae bacterium]